VGEFIGWLLGELLVGNAVDFDIFLALALADLTPGISKI
jgi:hypothetical protein